MKKFIKKCVKTLIRLFVRIFKSRRETIIKAAKYVITEANHTSPKAPKRKNNYFRPTVEELCLELAQYDIISFDIFDTLIFRAFPDPKAIFDLWGCKFNLQYGRKMRSEVERELRAESGIQEITLEQIYDKLSIRSGIDKAIGMQAEIDLELCYCRTNPFLLEVFRRLLLMGKKVIIVSDMYLPKYVIEQMLEKCGYTGYNALYVSGDCGKTKASGEIYDLITNIYGRNKSYIQIGDNAVSDIQNAKEHGWSSYHYESIHKIGKPFRPDGMSSLGGGLYLGVIDSFLYAGPEKADPYYELGFVHFGMLVYGYCRWLNKLAKETSADLILFAARDMYIIQKVYNECFGQIDNEYISVSRLAILRADFKKSSEMFLTCLKDAYTGNDKPILIGEYFSSIGFDFIFPLLERYGLKETDRLKDSSFLLLRSLIYDHKSYILEKLEVDHDAAVKYYSKLFEKHNYPKTVLFADMNGRCTSVLGAQHILEDAKLKTKMLGAQMYSISNKGFVEIKLSENTLFTYLFSYLKNRTRYNNFKQKGIPMTRVIEAIFTEPKGTLLSYTNTTDDGMTFGNNMCETEHLIKIHQGIIDFAKEYHKYAIKIDSEFWVSPLDAIIPAEQIIHRIPKLFPSLHNDMTLGH